MFRDKERYGQDPNKVIRSKPATFDAPLKWQREAERGERVGHDQLVFTCSWSDWFIEEGDPWRDEAWAIIRACPLLTFQVLTKRIERWRRCWPSVPVPGHVSQNEGDGRIWERFPNVWLGVSVEDQVAADRRISELLKTPVNVRFLSVEPLLGPVDLGLYRVAIPKHRESWPVERTKRFWCVVGGESGNSTGKYQARPCDLAWIRSVIRQCREAGVPCWVKQVGSYPFDSDAMATVPGCNDLVGDVGAMSQADLSTIERCMEAGAVRLKDRHGGDWSEWADDLRVREMPETIHA